MQQWLDAEAEFARPDLTLGQLVGAYVRSAVAHRAMSLIFLRESLEDVPDGSGGIGPQEVADLRRRQAAGSSRATSTPPSSCSRCRAPRPPHSCSPATPGG